MCHDGISLSTQKFKTKSLSFWRTKRISSTSAVRRAALITKPVYLMFGSSTKDGIARSKSKLPAERSAPSNSNTKRLSNEQAPSTGAVTPSPTSVRGSTLSPYSCTDLSAQESFFNGRAPSQRRSGKVKVGWLESQ